MSRATGFIEEVKARSTCRGSRQPSLWTTRKRRAQKKTSPTKKCLLRYRACTSKLLRITRMQCSSSSEIILCQISSAHFTRWKVGGYPLIRTLRPQRPGRVLCRARLLSLWLMRPESFVHLSSSSLTFRRPSWPLMISGAAEKRLT
jgi:hypothetical protein